MTTLLQEFEEWLKEEIKFNQYDDLGQALKIAQGKLESLKKKHSIEKWSMPEEEMRWLEFNREVNALKEKYKIGENERQ